MADPANVFAARRHPHASAATRCAGGRHPGRRAGAIDRYYRADSDLDDLTSASRTPTTASDDLAGLKEVVEDAPIVKFVNLLITQAIQDRASDIHLEPGEHDLGCATASTACCTR